MAATNVVHILRGPYDALVRALRSDASVEDVRLAPGGGRLCVSFAGGASFDLSPRGGRDVAFLTSLHSSERGRGHAGRAMRTLLAHARACGASIEIEVRPYGDVGLNGKALFGFYGRLGFRPQARSMMAFRP